MKGFLLICIVWSCLLTLWAFTNTSKKVPYSQEAVARQEGIEQDTIDTEYATYFVVIADTGLNYGNLHHKMLTLHAQLKCPIDSMGRTYIPAKNLIAVPQDSDDEIHAGEYYPRRFPSVDLSIEYLFMYQNRAGAKTMALVRGIYETQQDAGAALLKLKQIEKKAFMCQAKMFTGCMH